ncbi:MAG: hypothetical protein KC646_16050 [Candidatus Cloacimonetes bacterium]|nr:hypothetical protein [Candidatus Cloacimonadota bacterium]
MIDQHLNEEEIFSFLEEVFRELTFYDEPITKQTLLVDEIGLDSLDFLEVFFKIQSKLQELFGEDHNIEINEQEIQNQLIQIVLEDPSVDLDPNRPELFFTQMKVHHIITLIQQQFKSHLDSNKALDLLKPHIQELLKAKLCVSSEQKDLIQKNSSINPNDDIWSQFKLITIDDIEPFILSEYVQTQAVNRYISEVGINVSQVINMQKDDFKQELEDFLVQVALKEWLQNKKFGFLGYESRQALNLAISEAIENYLPSIDLSSFSKSDSPEKNEKLSKYLQINLFSHIQDQVDQLIKQADSLKILTEKYLNDQTGSDLVNFQDLNSEDGQKHVVSQFILSSIPQYLKAVVEQFEQEQKVNDIAGIKQEVSSDEQDEFLSRWDQLDDEDDE